MNKPCPNCRHPDGRKMLSYEMPIADPGEAIIDIDWMGRCSTCWDTGVVKIRNQEMTDPMKVFWLRKHGHTLLETSRYIIDKCLAHDHPTELAYTLSSVMVNIENNRIEGLYKTTPKTPGVFLPYPEGVPQPQLCD